MRMHLQRLSTWSRIMAGGAALIALIQLIYLGYLMFASAPPPPSAKSLNPAGDSFGEVATLLMKVWTTFALIVALANAGLNWLASLRYRSAEQYGLLTCVAAFNLGFGAIVFNLWVTSILGCLLGIPIALYAAIILIGDDTKKVFRLVETGRSLEEALAGGGPVPGLSGRRGAVQDLDEILAVETGLRKPPAGSGLRSAPVGSELRAATAKSGLGSAPAGSGKRPTPGAAAKPGAPRKNPPAQ